MAGLITALVFALVLPLAAVAAEENSSSSAAPASTPAPGPDDEKQILDETPLLQDARKRPPKELWLEMTQIQDEMHARAKDGDYAPLSDLAKRMHADMFGAFLQVFEPLVQPRRIGLKRAVLNCGSLTMRMDQAVKANWPTEIEGAMSFVDGCMTLLGRFYPPEMTGLPDEFAAAKPAGSGAAAPESKAESKSD